MPAPTPQTVTLSYHVKKPPTLTLAQLAAAFAAVPLPFGDIGQIAHVTFVSDTPGTTPPDQADRVIVYSFQPPLLLSNPQACEFTGSIVAQSPFDQAMTACDDAGQGARTVLISYRDALGAPFTESVNLNGQRCVPLVNPNKATIDSIVVTDAGAFGGNVGQISIFAGTDCTGALVATLGESFAAMFPQATDACGNVTGALDRAASFRNLFTMALSAAMRLFVIADEPVITP